MIKKIAFLLLISILVLAAIYGLKKKNEVINNKNNFKISTSFYPYYFFASEIAGNKAEVINITPSGAEPHDYEPTTADIITIQSSSILVLNGLVEPWAAKIKSDLQGKQTKILEMAGSLFTQNVANENGILVVDPHIWLDPVLAKKQIKAILDELLKLDPKNRDYYYNNANRLLSEINKLDQNYRTGLASCQLKDIVTSHAAFGYLASEYGLKQVPIAGLSPDSEPSLKQLTQITNFVEQNGIKYIFFESLVSPKLAETIASETGAKTLVLNPLEGLTPNDLSSGKNYLTVMQDNLVNLRTALQCR